MKNIESLIDDLSDVYEKTKAGEIERPLAAELANLAGKIIKGAAISLSYNQFMKNGKTVKFLECKK